MTTSIYPYPSFLNTSSFVSVKLASTDNYSRWHSQLLCLIESQELVGFIDGSILPPPITTGGAGDWEEDEEEEVVENGREYQIWKRSDRLVKGWILGSLHEHVLDIVLGLITARDVWSKLESTLGPDSQENIKDEGAVSIARQEGSNFKFYPYPFKLNVGNFVSIKLTNNNYLAWSTQIYSLLDIQALMSFITEPAPPKYYDKHPDEDGQNICDEYKRWRETDLLVKGWILGSISEEAIPMVLSSTDSSRDIMGKLEETFVSDIKTHIIFKKQIPSSPIEGGDAIINYLPLYKAALMGDWETAKDIMDRDIDTATNIIARNQEAVIHLAGGTGKATHFLENLVEYLPTETLTLRNGYGDTALCIAASIGNTEGAKILIRKNPDLLHIRNSSHRLPLHLAAQCGQRETLMYLRTVSCDNDYAGQDGADLLSSLVTVGYFDIALDLIKEHPHVTRMETSQGFSPPLNEIASQGFLFRSGYHLNFLESFIYRCISLKFEDYLEDPSTGEFDIESPAHNSQELMLYKGQPVRVCERLNIMLWDILEILGRYNFHTRGERFSIVYFISKAFLSHLNFIVPAVKKLRQRKVIHHQAVQLVKWLCEGIRSTNNAGAIVWRTTRAVTGAASLGIVEVVEEIVNIFPIAVWCRDDNGHDIAELAVLNRCENVYNLIYQMSGYRQHIVLQRNESRNSILHLAGRLAPVNKLNLVSGAALQMQRELQWFLEVVKLKGPSYKGMKNSSGENPEMIFTREHTELVIAGEKWMKDTANSCTIAAALIITIVFAGAISVPGGSDGNTGLPIFYKGNAFWLFAISDLFSLFTSTTSLFMFLSILTARYAEEDFLHALPKRLILGLLTLFLSIASMIIAFSATVFLVFGQRKAWTIIPLVVLSLLPITSFVTLQFPLLIDVYSSTYGRGIFHQQGDRPLR